MSTWIIGEGGLLGSALARATAHRFSPGSVTWHNPDSASRTLRDQLRAFREHAGTGPWRIIWAAGAATTSTPRDKSMAELTPLRALVDDLATVPPAGQGAFFLASSAGGVYAGASGAPFDVHTPPSPLSPYGELKLAQEHLVREVLGQRIPAVIGRISNLYGPGQNLDKLQGLISRLALAAATRQPVNIFVPLGTIRDYLFADDAAAAIHRTLDDAASPASTTQLTATTHIIASGRGVTIGQLLRTMNEVAKRRVPVALGSHPSSAAQAVDLRLIQSVDLPQATTLPAGIKSVHDDIAWRVQERALLG